MCGVVGRMSQRRNTTMQPAAKRISKGSTPSSAAAAAAIPVTARNLVFTAVRPKPQSACKTTAIITGLAPYSTPTACGSIPNRRYATAIVVTRIAAGRMNEIPATRRPATGAQQAYVQRHRGPVGTGKELDRTQQTAKDPTQQ